MYETGAPLRRSPETCALRPIVPLVLYQGERSWAYSTEFADLFAEAVRAWPGVPRFAHGLIDQSGLQPDEVQGERNTQLMQLLLLAAAHPAVAWMEQVARLLGALAGLPPSSGVNYVRIFGHCSIDAGFDLDRPCDRINEERAPEACSKEE